MANKLDTEKPLFLGPVAVREGTVADEIRKAVSHLDSGQGVKYSDLERHLLENYTPKKSQNYSASFIKSYVRDGVNRYDHLSHTSGGHEYSCLAAPEPKARTGGTRKPGRAEKEKTEILQFVRDQANIADQSELDAKSVTTDDMVRASGRKAKTINKMVDDLQTAGLVRTEDSESTVVAGDTERKVFLTPAGYVRANEAAPEGAGSDEETVRQENVAEAQTEAADQNA
jgi:hypothetical protein